MNLYGQIFRLKTLGKSVIPARWVVVHFCKGPTSARGLTLKNGTWLEGRLIVGPSVSVASVASMARTSEVCWVVCENVYEWLCSQSLYEQIVDGSVTLPLGSSQSNKGKLTGAFATGDPCIIDMTVCGKKLHIIDFLQLGIHNVANLNDAVTRLQDYVRMVVEMEMGSLKSTSAAQGTSRFRTHDMDNLRIYCHTVPEVRQLERDSFYGGRCEVVRMGKATGTCYHFDAVSMHPTIGLKEKFPTRLVDYGPAPSAALLCNYCVSGKQVIAKVRIKTPCPDYPVRLSMPGDDGRTTTIYPVGEFDTTLPHPEFRHAMEHRRIVKAYAFAAYDCEAIFVRNSTWFFAAKARLESLGLSHMAGSLKLAQNSMYGNLGRRGRRWIDTTKWTDLDWGIWWARHPEVGNVVQHRAVYGVHQYLDAAQEPDTSMPAVSATMFSYCRLRLLEMIEKARWANTLYYATDGITVSETGANLLENFRFPLKLKWKSCDVEHRGIAYYRHDDVWTHAGVPEWAERLPDGSARFERHEPFNASMWKKCPFLHRYMLTHTDPHPVYRHGVVGRDGTISPHVLPFEE